MSLVSSLARWLRRKVLARRVLTLAAHVALYAAVFLGVFLLRFDFSFPEQFQKQIIVGLAAIVILRTAAGLVFRIYGGVLKYAGIKDLVDIVKAMTIASAAFVVVIVLFGFRNFPCSIIAIDWLGSIMLIGGLRFGLRLVRESMTAGQYDAQRKRVIILGAGDAGEALVRDLQRTYRDRYEVVGFLDDNRSKRGLRIHDVRVLGPMRDAGCGVENGYRVLSETHRGVYWRREESP